MRTQIKHKKESNPIFIECYSYSIIKLTKEKTFPLFFSSFCSFLFIIAFISIWRQWGWLTETWKKLKFHLLFINLYSKPIRTQTETFNFNFFPLLCRNFSLPSMINFFFVMFFWENRKEIIKKIFLIFLFFISISQNFYRFRIFMKKISLIKKSKGVFSEEKEKKRERGKKKN